jgi:ribosomal protein L11 methyltransferase
VAETKWRQINLDLDERLVDAICGVLWDEGASGVEIADDETRTLPDAPKQRTKRAQIRAPFAMVPGLEARVVGALQQLQTHFDLPMDMELTWSDLELQDWNACFKSEWKSFSLLPGVVIVPSWEKAPTTQSDLILHLDPGMAFGTGIHETTRLCAMALQEELKSKKPTSLLDVGTGTGILAILGLKLGIPRAVATDIDPLALDAANENAEKNGVAPQLTLRNTRPSATGERHPLVIANILAQPLIDMARDLADAVATGGLLFLSGILKTQEESVKDAYVRAGFQFRKTTSLGEWIRIDLTKN